MSFWDIEKPSSMLVSGMVMLPEQPVSITLITNASAMNKLTNFFIIMSSLRCVSFVCVFSFPTLLHKLNCLYVYYNTFLRLCQFLVNFQAIILHQLSKLKLKIRKTMNCSYLEIKIKI